MMKSGDQGLYEKLILIFIEAFLDKVKLSAFWGPARENSSSSELFELYFLFITEKYVKRLSELSFNRLLL
ncbi:hypothetical protein HU830_00535 [Lactobacillus sp. DCY120]|uniref:Uncharacterized protein n=1 Tax=Bombilactobacillus apium TaxID=2675299 RepID=A0A850R8G7_9LACO|nr:hypothetical protein [Bombilactobacillus apium]NVY95696.1 hypothetical protein [Bombilactobacillus apium]